MDGLVMYCTAYRARGKRTGDEEHGGYRRAFMGGEGRRKGIDTAS